MMFALSTRETHLIPKSTCVSIMSDVSSLFSTFFEQLSEFIVCRLEENGFDIGRDVCLQHILLDHSFVDSVWSNVRSDAKLKQFCKEKLGLVEAESVTLGFHETTGKPERGASARLQSCFYSSQQIVFLLWFYTLQFSVFSMYLLLLTSSIGFF